jgi:hypothetical protein
MLQRCTTIQVPVELPAVQQKRLKFKHIDNMAHELLPLQVVEKFRTATGAENRHKKEVPSWQN